MLFQINHIHKYPYLTHYIAPCICFNSYDTRDFKAFDPLGTNYFCWFFKVRYILEQIHAF